MRNVILEQLLPSGAGKQGESSIFHDLQHASPAMLLEWIHLEKSAVIDMKLNLWMRMAMRKKMKLKCMDQLERISVLRDKVLPLLHSIHKLGVELDHVQISNVSKDLYVQVEKELSGCAIVL